MARMMPRAINPAAFDSIRKETDRLHSEAESAGGDKWQSYSEDLRDQALFLDAFEKNFTIHLALRYAGVTSATYNRWRSTSITFVERFNEIVEMWHEDIYVSAAMRARGIKITDKETGDVAYIDGDTQLTKVFLRAMHEEFDERVDINLTGGMNNTTTPLNEEAYMALRKKMIEEDDC